MNYPKIYLALDNCFAIKRWVHPKDWMKIVSEIGGISYVEASTDNEIDPLFNTPKYRRQWLSDVDHYGDEYGIRLCSFFSGYATYRTSGLTHWDKSSRRKLRKNYFNMTVDMAQRLGCHVGVALNAFPETVLENPQEFHVYKKVLETELCAMAVYASQKNTIFCYEQMYSPNMGFWLIDECRQWMQNIYEKTKTPMYITIDTAHQVGQKLYRKPTRAQIENAIENKSARDLRVGTALSKMIESEQTSIDEIFSRMDEYDYLFSQEQDGDIYAWMEALGCYSPVVHLQQTDGNTSAHRPFTEKWNQTGIVKPDKVLQAIAKSYEQKADLGMPPMANEIYLAFELFFGINEQPESIIRQIRESVQYWRSYIPADGCTLDQLI